MRVLIIGGGIAGLSLAAKLTGQGQAPVVIEKRSEYGEHGYSLSLYPFGSAVLDEVGVYERFAAASVEMRTYEIADRYGDVIRSIDFSGLLAGYGGTRFSTHPAVVELLRNAAGEAADIRMGTMIRDLEEADDEIEAKLSDGSREAFDLVVGCDGVHSATRELLFGTQPRFDTGWVGWTWWGREGIFPPERVREHWLSGAFFGVYPAPGRSMFFAALPSGVADPNSRLETPRALLRISDALREVTKTCPEIDEALDEPVELWPWSLSDVRSRALRRGRVVLCGDAGTAFLPTAGVGASIALGSAAALADELSRVDADGVPLALDRYLQRTTKVARAHQRDARRLAKAMFIRNPLAAWGRDRLVRYVPVRSIIRSIVAASDRAV